MTTPKSRPKKDTSVFRTDSHETVERIDYGRLGNAIRTPSGGYRIPANLTRTGVLTYYRPDGTPFKELRHPKEVFAKESLATLGGAPVTDLHPKIMVNVDNWKDLAVGHVGEQVNKDDKFVKAEIYVQDSKTISAIQRGDRKEISMGYACRLDMTPGEYNGEKYDAIQRDIRYNHAAIGPNNWGRAGTEVSLHLDAAGHSVILAENKEKIQMKTIRIDGVDYEIGSSEHLAKLDSMRVQAVAVETKRADEAEGKLTVETKRADDAEKALEAANDPKRIDSLVASRVSTVTKAQSILGAEAKLDGKSDREIMLMVLDASDNLPFEEDDDDEKKDSVSMDTIRGMFSMCKGEKKVDAIDEARTRTIKKDGNGKLDKFDAEGHKAAFMQKTEDAWKQPLAVSK